MFWWLYPRSPVLQIRQNSTTVYTSYRAKLLMTKSQTKKRSNYHFLLLSYETIFVLQGLYYNSRLSPHQGSCRFCAPNRPYRVSLNPIRLNPFSQERRLCRHESSQQFQSENVVHLLEKSETQPSFLHWETEHIPCYFCFLRIQGRTIPEECITKTVNLFNTLVRQFEASHPKIYYAQDNRFYQLHSTNY